MKDDDHEHWLTIVEQYLAGIRAAATSEEENGTEVQLQLGIDKVGDKSGPILHVLMPDGTDHPFRDRCFLMRGFKGGDSDLAKLPSPDDPEQAILMQLVNGKGEPWFDEDGDPIYLPVTPFHLTRRDETTRMITQAEVAKRAGVEKTTVYRATKNGELTKRYVGGRHPRFKEGDVLAWINQKKNGSK